MAGKRAVLRLLLVVVLAAMLGAVVVVDAKMQHSRLVRKGTDSWDFLGKFCFSKGVGNLTWTAWANNDVHARLLFYDDAPNSWPKVYPNRRKLNCTELTAMSSPFEDGTTGGLPIVSGLPITTPFRDTKRPHYWYIAASNCGGRDLDLRYDFHFTNPGSSWKTEFSYDEQGLAEMYLFYWVMSNVVFALHLYGFWVLHKSKSLHPIVKLLTVALALNLVSLFSNFIHYMVYKANGIGTSGLAGFGEWLDLSSQVVFLLLVVLIGSGWCVTYQRIPRPKLTLALISIFAILYFVLFIVDKVSSSPAETLYLYESVPGILIVVLRSITLMWFLWMMYWSYERERVEAKIRFYFAFASVYSLWFLSLPFIVCVAAFLPAWIRMKIVIGLYLTVNFLAQSAMVVLFWPTIALVVFRISPHERLVSDAGEAAEGEDVPYQAL